LEIQSVEIHSLELQNVDFVVLELQNVAIRSNDLGLEGSKLRDRVPLSLILGDGLSLLLFDLGELAPLLLSLPLS
jgi:hypothetical protein